LLATSSEYPWTEFVNQQRVRDGGAPAVVSAAMELLEGKVVYEGFGVDVKVGRYRRTDGTEATRQVIEHPGSVAILAHDDEHVYLVAQPRESGLEAAKREQGSGTRDEDEAIDIVRLPLATLDEALPKIRDAVTLVALMMLRERLAGA
jgi:hypothetical protein